MKLYYQFNVLCCFFIFTACLVSPLLGHSNPDIYSTGAVKGVVKDASGNTLPGVNITLPELSRGTVSRPDGSYLIGNIPAGTYKITFSFIGFASKSKQVTISKGETYTLNTVLEEQTLKIADFTVTGSAYASDPLTTPADVDVLAGRAKFEADQTSLGATLDDLAGVSTISTGAQVGKPVIRGLSGNRIRVLNDGTAMDYQQFGVRHGPNIDPFLADRIEVVRGAASVQYGSDAMGGAVSVISKPVPDAFNQAAFLRGQLLGTYATNNKEAAGGVHLQGASGGLGFEATLIRRSAGDIHTGRSDTFSESGDPNDPKFAGKLNHTDYDQFNGKIGAGYSGTFGHLKAEYTRYKNEQNFLLPNGKGLGQNLENNSFKLSSDLLLGNSFILKPTFTYNRNIRQSNAGGSMAQPRSKLPDEGRAFLDLLNDAYTAKVNMEHPKIGVFRGTLGIEYLQEDQHTRGTGQALVPSGTIDNMAAFIFEKTTLNAFTLSFGARIDNRKQRAAPNEMLNLPNRDAGETDGVLDHTYTNFSGSLGGTYSISSHFTVAANMARGFRAPSFFNLYVHGNHGGVAAFQVGDPSLKPERSLNTDMSLRWRSANITAKVTGYRNFISNYIFLVNTGDFAGPDAQGLPILRTTQGNAQLLGVDGHLQALFTPWLQVSSTFELVKGRNVDDDIKTVDELPLLPATRLSGSVKLMQNQLGFLENPFI